MKVVVLTGSAHKGGTSEYMADRFCAAALAKGHELVRFDCAFNDVHECIGCNSCKKTGRCIFNDDFVKIHEALCAADAVIFVSPIYFFGIASPLKKVIDRMYAFVPELRSCTRKTALITTGTANKPGSADTVNAYYCKLTEFFGWESFGIINAGGVPDRAALKSSTYPSIADNLALKI